MATVDVCSLNGVRVQLWTESDPLPYEHSDSPVTGCIILPDETVVYAGDQGCKSTLALSDGTEVESWIRPARLDDDTPAHDLLTRPQFEALEFADKVANLFFSEDVEDLYPDIDFKRITLPELHQLMAAQAAKAAASLR